LAIIGDEPSFVDADDPDTISIVSKPTHPAVPFLLSAIESLGRDHVRVAVEWMEEAMTAISVHDGLMVEF
jgi:hypothetical protein